MKNTLRIGIVALSSVVPPEEFELGIRKLNGLLANAGGQEPQVPRSLSISVAPHALDPHRFFSSSDENRFKDLIQLATDPNVSVVWAARGGYGAARLLPLLKQWTQDNGSPPKKLFVGFSDSTALFDFLVGEWQWEVLHAPMPGLRKFFELPPAEGKALQDALWAYSSGSEILTQWSSLVPVGDRELPSQSASIAGGNLSLICSLLGTDFEMDFQNKFVFLEECDEALYRLDRLAQQLASSRSIRNARAVFLGNFSGCTDRVPLVLNHVPKPGQESAVLAKIEDHHLRPLRAKLDPVTEIREIFRDFSERSGLPVYAGLPVGHGPEKFPLPLYCQADWTLGSKSLRVRGFARSVPS